MVDEQRYLPRSYVEPYGTNVTNFSRGSVEISISSMIGIIDVIMTPRL